MNEEKIATFFTYLSSQQTAQKFLHKCYEKQQIKDAEMLSYDNSLAFLYYLEHGKQFYETAENIPLSMKPILLFYGMTHLIKASLLTCRPFYPETTKLLAHGVSTRKRKRKDYTFLNDGVKVQQFGLFPYFAKHLCDAEPSSAEKYKMIHLLSLIPEINELFSLRGKNTLCKVGKVNQNLIIFPNHMLDTYHLTEEAFIKRVGKFLPMIKDHIIAENNIQIKLVLPFDNIKAPFYTHMNEDIYFPISRTHYPGLSELMIHYLILYNLSMVSRYETEWWGDLINVKPDMDFPFIQHFLHVTSKKVPIIIGQHLSYDHFFNK